MNRTDRLLAIVLQLQTRPNCRAEDLAALFETSKRTIYRDIQSLSEAGVPIISMPGHGYSIMEGYFLPPLSFTVDEATMLLLGVDVMRQSFDAEYRQSAEFAAAKITGVLPPQVREDVEWLRHSLVFITPGTQNPGEAERLQTLRRAIVRKRRVRFQYHARQSDEPTTQREVDPYGLIYIGDVWILMAFDHLRGDVRNFRLSRMGDVTMTASSFTRPDDYLEDQSRRMTDGRDIVVRLLFSDAVARWVLEERFFYISDRQMTSEGLVVTLRVREPQDVLQWVLGWGSNVRVLEPDALCALVVEQARKILQNHENPESLLT